MLERYDRPISRAEVLLRAEQWLPQPRPYSQQAYSDGYRTDCSGYVSMAWRLSPGLTGGTNTTGLAQVAHPITRDELQPGDVLLKLTPETHRHTVLFDGWTDPSHTTYWAYEQVGRPFSRTMHHIVAYPYGTHPELFSPWRYNQIT